MADSEATTMAGGKGDDLQASSSASARLREGALIARRYRLVGRLGAGAMGEVWRARHEELNTELAIKFAFAQEDDESAIERFRFEAQVSAQLGQKTPHIVAVHDAGRHAGVAFLAMEYVPGRSLEDILERDGALDEESVAAILDDVSSALTVSHAAGIWHRDIKPANIMVVAGDDGRPHAKVADFGVSKTMMKKLAVETPGTTVAGALVGTPGYMSPEQIEHAGDDVGATSDVWSLGVVAYEAVTGTIAFDSQTVSQLLVTICSRPHRPPGDVAPHLAKFDSFFDRALAKDPVDRIGTAAELAAAFREAMAVPAERRPSRRRVVAFALGALAIATTVGVVVTSGEPEVAADEAADVATNAATSEETEADEIPTATPDRAPTTDTKATTDPPTDPGPQPPATAPRPPPSSAVPPPPSPPAAPSAPPQPEPQPRAFDKSEVL